MSEFAFELSVIFLLLLTGGFFSTAEVAVTSAGKPKLRHLAEQGDWKAQMALELAESPARFISTVKTGITLTGIVNGVFCGAALAPLAAAMVHGAPWLAPWAGAAAFAAVVPGLTFLTLVFCELAPRRIGMSRPESIACAVAPFMTRLSKLAAPVVVVLDFIADTVLKTLRVKPLPEPVATEEEIHMLVREGSRAGLFHEHEPEMVESVMALDRVLTRELMTPRTRIIWVNVNDTGEILWHKVVVSGHSQFPVYEKSRDNVLGMISLKSIYANTAAGVPLVIRDLTVQASFVPATLKASSLLDNFQKTGKHTALVLDEFGGITGLVTLHDIMEAIVGELPSPGDRSKPTALKHEDGTWLVDGMMDLDGFDELLPFFELPPPAERDYQTIAGFVMKHLGHMPVEGESFLWSGYQVQVLDLEGFRIDRLLFMPVKNTGKAAQEAADQAEAAVEAKAEAAEQRTENA